MTAVARSLLTVCNGRAPHGLLVTYSELSITLDVVIVSRFSAPCQFLSEVPLLFPQEAHS